MYGSVAGFRACFFGSAFSSIPDSVITTALNSASAFSDGYIRKRFTLPLEGAYPALDEHIYFLAAYSVLQYRGFDPTSSSDRIILENRNFAIQWLRDVAKGLVEPGFVDATADVEENSPLAASGDLGNWTGFFRA